MNVIDLTKRGQFIVSRNYVCGQWYKKQMRAQPHWYHVYLWFHTWELVIIIHVQLFPQ